MNFKEWLLISEEEEKDINLSNPNLTSTIPPLNTSLSNPNLTNTKISNRELSSNQKVKELAIKYTELGRKYPRAFNNFLKYKRKAYDAFINNKIKSNSVWYPSDIKVARDNGLPDNWILPVDYEKESNDKLKELAIYYGRNGSKPSQYDSDKKDKILANWLYDKKKTNPNPYEASDKKTWADMVELFKTPDLIDPDTKKPFLYTNLPNDWRDVKPNGRQKYLQKNQITSSKNLEKLAYYYGKNGSGPSVDFNKENKSLAGWLNGKKYRQNLHEKSDDITWAKIVELSKNWNKEQFPYELPEDWREIEPAGEKSLGEKLVLNILTELKIKNDPQHRDVACKNKICLPFDFSITHNGEKYLEFNGGQHYYPVYFGSVGEEKTDQVKAKDALEQFEYTKKNDTIKYDHCVKENIPFLVIPYWLYETPDIIKSTIIEFLNTNQFDKKFADPNVPQKNKAYHDKMYAKYLAELNPTELVEPTKTFEQFLINKNFTYYNA